MVIVGKMVCSELAGEEADWPPAKSAKAAVDAENGKCECFERGMDELARHTVRGWRSFLQDSMQLTPSRTLPQTFQALAGSSHSV